MYIMIANMKLNRTQFIFLFLIPILAIIVSFSICAYGLIRQEAMTKGTLYPHVLIDSLPVAYKTKDSVLGMYAEKEKKIQKSIIYISYKNTVIATYSAELLDLHTNIDEIYERAYYVGRSSHAPSRYYQKVAALLGLEVFPFTTQIQYNKAYVADALSQFEDSYNVPAKNALFKFENNKVTTFQKEEKGNKLLADLFLKDIEQSVRSLKYRQQNIVVTLREVPVEPDITLAKANHFGIEELIGEGVSNYTHSIPTRIHNVILAAAKFNGVMMQKNKVFSFGDAIGDISANTGYQPAYIIKEGKTVLGDGGGVCQVSTTFFRAALNAGLPIIEQHAHAYRVSYYENDSKPGLDATIFSPTVDLKVENDTPTDILIQTIVDEDKMLLYFKLYGKKDGRNIEMSTPVLFDVASPPLPVYQDDPTLKRGVVKQVDFAAWGGKAKFDYKVTKNNEVLFEKNFYSVYKPWAAVFLVGTQD
ncbi:hypothetical protein COY90_05575 [Candidatus Roizmanbacteria bacterium CG_4_10_14_0_8_um_filter_39_9]|uniref:YoaR-like putative peptidoglycan binding domain-containing protein n=1 Tax=Candidatus Roizmanbacteria bacterium CG_4_10_14_0_8_um_filter_39_9 TaxID=1974829 RepID=A0A2M7QBC4_9BACT|nr:MAG: hypothetical protein COY90_05575 [Candidatus Roizmanbacteria bacterium CG_4_10_14_0_8_um_filter_39_9]